MQTHREELRILQMDHELPAAMGSAPSRGWTDPANPASPTLASPNSPCRCSSCLPSTDLEMGHTSDCSPPSSALVTHHAPWTIPLLSHICSHSHLNSGNPGCSTSLSTWIFAGVTYPDPWFSLWATWRQDTGYPHNQQWLLLNRTIQIGRTLL